MPLPSAETFKANTSALKTKIFRKSYSGSIVKVYTALEAYGENINGDDRIKEQLLYALWKEARHWLERKRDRIGVDNSELFMRRVMNVEIVRDESLAELEEVNPGVARALNRYQDQKMLQGRLNVNMQPLGQGYTRERQQYLQQGKRGNVSSQSYIHQGMHDNLNNNNRKARTLAQKGFGDLTLAEQEKLTRMFPNYNVPVLYMNKMARLRYLVSINENGLCCNVDEELISMLSQHWGQYEMSPYAIDKYGNLYTGLTLGNNEYVSHDKKGNVEIKVTGAINHSSYLSGEDVLCAGCIHIGYSCAAGKLEPGAISAIDNVSGHYRPSTEHFENALAVLRDQGINTDAVRIGHRTQDGLTYYWGRDFRMGRRKPWASVDQAPVGFLKAPPIRPTGA
jgi:hypothetical protein